MAACARDGLRSRERRSLALALPDLCDGIDDAADETDKDGADAGKGDGGVEEDQAGEGDGKLVESADHGVSG